MASRSGGRSAIFLFNDSSPEFLTYDAFVNHTMNAFLCPNYPESCISDGTFSKQMALVSDTFVKVFRDQKS